MDKCKHNKHLFLLSSMEKMTYNYYAHEQKPKCLKCQKAKDVTKVVKYTTSKTMRRVSAITGALRYNDTRCKPNDHFYCKKCEYYF